MVPKAEMSFIEHLDELRGHLFKSVIAIVIGAIVMAIYNSFIVKKILMGPTQCRLPNVWFFMQVEPNAWVWAVSCA